MTKQRKKRKAERVWDSKNPDDNMPQRSTKDIADEHAKQEIDVPQEREAMNSLGTNERGKELFNFVLKGMVKPGKK